MAFWPSHRCKRFPELDKNARRPIFVVFELPAQQVVPRACITALFLTGFAINIQPPPPTKDWQGFF